jgi:ribosomal protein S18 acetylase RimI-like enzyme
VLGLRARPSVRQPWTARGYSAVVSQTETPFLIRPVRPDEYAALGDLIVVAYHAVAPDMPHQDDYDVELRDVERRARTSCVVVASTPAGELLGGVTYVTGPQDPYSEDLREGEAGIRMLAVDTARQRVGVGRALTRWCIERARAEGRRRVLLHTGPWMPGAVRLYEGLGFVRDPERDFVPVPGIHLIAYAFEL